MTPELRDWFAAHIAAALAAEQRLGLEAIAARAYDVADALMAERDKRIDSELAAIVDDAAPTASAAHLLDEATPWEDREEDDVWSEAVQGREPSLSPPSGRPGLARTQLELPIDQRSRKSGS